MRVIKTKDTLCKYCQNNFATCSKENHIEFGNKIGGKNLYGIRLEAWHLKNGEGDAMFNDECDKLLNSR